MLDCRNVESVLNTVQERWRTYAGTRLARGEDIYSHLAAVLNGQGWVTDDEDGLEVLEHCRRANLPIVDLLHELEERVRRNGYVGGSLSLADYANGAQMAYVFFDSSRYDRFAEVRAQLRA